MASIHQDLIDRICVTDNAVLEYDSVTNDLRTWPWPIDNRLERVPLYNLSDYRTTHCIQNPCCFCACPGSTGARDVIESAIYIAATGPYRGFWVAGCAQNVSCGYFVPLDHLYLHEGIPTASYTRRAPPPVNPRSGDGVVDFQVAPANHGSAKKAHTGRELVVLPKFNPPPNAVVTTTELVSRLDSWLRPGLTLSQFLEVFAQCKCGMVVTRRVFDRHECVRYPKDLGTVDLTEENA